MKECEIRAVLVGLTALLGCLMPAVATAQSSPPATDLSPGPVCPLDRVAMVRGSDSEARQGGGFYAARKNGIHGAVDLNGSVGEPVYAVAGGMVIVAAHTDWGALGKTVVIDHRDGGYTTYAHLDRVGVNVNRPVAAGDMIGTIGYSGNAAGLRAKQLPPHLHFAYFRPVREVNGRIAPLAQIKSSGEGVRSYYAKDAIMADVAGIVDPLRAVGFRTCWQEPFRDPSEIASPRDRLFLRTPSR